MTGALLIRLSITTVAFELASGDFLFFDLQQIVSFPLKLLLNLNRHALLAFQQFQLSFFWLLFVFCRTCWLPLGQCLYGVGLHLSLNSLYDPPL